jgi:hypothetical protein
LKTWKGNDRRQGIAETRATAAGVVTATREPEPGGAA